jgi:hypothetical protein
MPRYVSDQNKAVLLFESGTYGTASGNGYWLGEVTDISVDDQENLLVDRFMGAATRSVAQWVGGPRVVEGTVTYNLEDMRMPFIAIGSINSTSGTNNIHYVNQVETSVWQNPFCSGTNQLNGPRSFQIEASATAAATNGNIVNTLKGCVINSCTINAVQGEKVNCELNLIAQNLTYTSGATTSVTVPSLTPYLWSNCTLTLSGTTVNTAKEVSLEINNNIEGPHYLVNSRDISTPILGNRDSVLSVTMDADSAVSNLLYQLYKSNASFNSVFDLNADVTAIGSQHTIFFMSGCKINKIDMPLKNEGVVEGTVEIVVPTIIGSAIETVRQFNPW